MMKRPPRRCPRPARLALALVLLALCSAPPSATAPGTPEDTSEPAGSTEWRVATGNQASQRYAPLAQIDARNVARLEEVWRWSSPDNALRAGNEDLQNRRMEPGSHEISPLKIGDRLYVITGYQQIAALDAATGENRWTYDPEAYRHGRPPNLGFVHRGATYLEDAEGRGRVVYGSGDAFLRAVDAFTGEPIGTFGDAGAVDLTLGMRREVARRGYGVSSPVVHCNGVLVVGSSVSDGQTSPTAPPGDVRGFDALTGELLWTFQSVPQEGEFGNQTWEGDSWRITGNTNVWTLMSADEALGLVYLPFGTPTNDWYGGHRLGDNLFAETLVAVDCKSGRRLWHYQTTRHGLWDYDLVTSPILGDVTLDGRRVPGIFQLTKQGFVFALDRRTGAPLWPIEERPVPPSTVPGEVAAATQPFPTKPPPYERQGVSEDDLIDFTPELRSAALELLEQYHIGPIYTPPAVDKPTLNLPGWAGGSSWQGGAFDPDTGFLYVPSFTLPISLQLVAPDPNRSSLRYVGRVNPLIEGPEGLPLLKPPYARLTAYDMNRGEIAWQEVLGDGPRDHPALRELDLPPLGQVARSHVLATKTLLFVVSSAGLGRGYSVSDGSERAYLRAFDKATGKMLLERELDKTADGTPITYLENGRQYLVFALGGREEPQELVAFALPQAVLDDAPPAD